MRELNVILGELQALGESLDPREVDQAADCLSTADRIFVGGAGRSGLAMRALAMRLMHLGKEVHVMGEVTAPAIGSGDLLVVGSGSGRTASLVAAGEKARGLGATIVLFTIDATSPLADLAGHVVNIPAPSPKAVAGEKVESQQPMGSLFEQALFLLGDALIMRLMQESGETTDSMFSRHANLE